VSLEERVALLQAQLDAKNQSSTFKKVLRGLAAALTSPEAVKAEKSIAALVLGRLALTLPATAVFIDLILKAFGAPSVTP
jgi:hypothetical protein